MTELNWYLVADGEAHPLDHDQAVLLQTAADDNDDADELYRNLTGGQRYDGACGRDYVVTLAENDDDALLLSILYDHDEAALDNVACPDCGQTHITLYAATEDKPVQRAAAELMTAADHVADADGGCQCDFCKGGLNTIQQIAGFFPAGWWGETPEQREQAIEIARRAVGGA